MKRPLLFFMFLLVSTSAAQFGNDPKIIHLEPLVSVDRAVPGTRLEIALRVQVKKGYHINSNTPGADFLVPTALHFREQPHVEFFPVSYPQHRLMKFPFSDEKIAVYEGTFYLRSAVHLSDEFTHDSLYVSGELDYQGCDDYTCFAPTTLSFSKSVPVVEENSEIQFQHADVFDVALAKAPGLNTQLTNDEKRAQEILARGLPYAILAFFLFGLGLNLTPCVYPVIPMTVSYFGGAQTEGRLSAFRNALFYLIGIAIAFSLLGLLSALAGKQWGFLFTSPWFVVAVSLIILSMSASLFGAFEITVPSRLLTRVGGGKRGSLGALTMGLTVGVVIAPCAAGLIIGLVGLVAKMGLVAKGTLLFFFMGLGLGSPYLILGTFSGLLSKLPQSGMWMVWVRKLFGLVLIGVALYFLTPLIERVTEPFSFLLGFLVLFGGLLLGFLDQHSGYTRSFKRGRAVLGALLLVFGGVTVSNSLQFNPVSSKIESAIDWNYPDSDIIGPLLSAGKPAFIDFYADWCAPCKEMDQKTFRDSTVIELSRQITMIKIDCTHLDARTRALMEAYRVGGMPTLVFIDRQGREILNMREIGYVGPQAMADKFARLLQ